MTTMYLQYSDSNSDQLLAAILRLRQAPEEEDEDDEEDADEEDDDDEDDSDHDDGDNGYSE